MKTAEQRTRDLVAAAEVDIMEERNQKGAGRPTRDEPADTEQAAAPDAGEPADTQPARLCVATADGSTCIDLIGTDNRTECFGRTLDEVRREYPGAEIMPLETFCRRKAALQRTPITWTKTTRKRYVEMLEVLPPAEWQQGGFLVGEPFDHDALTGRPRYQAFRKRGPYAYEVASRPLTVAEFRTELEH